MRFTRECRNICANPNEEKPVKIWMLTLAVALCLLACHEDHDHDHNGHTHTGANTYNNHACDHLEFGPFADLTLASQPADAPTLAYMTHGKLSLASGETAYVTLDAVLEGNFAIATNGQPVVVQDDAGNTITPEYTADSVPECELVAFKGMYALEKKAYTVVFGPYDAAVEQGGVFIHPDSERTDE